MGKNKNSITVTFPWASADSVAGSQVLIEFSSNGNKRFVLVECGIIQGSTSILQEYQLNKKKFAFKPKKLDYVFTCHMHGDHISLIPRLYKEGYDGDIIMPNGSQEIFKEMIIDSGKIMERNADFLTRKIKKEYSPIYDSTDVQNTVTHIREFPKHQKIKLDNDISFEYINSGHIINSCQLILWVTCNNVTKKIVVTSDLGNSMFKQYYVEKFEPVDKADLLIGETTYCNPRRCSKPKDREKDLEKLKSAIDTTCIDRKGNVLIPAFSLHRFQVMLTYLYDLFHDDRNCPIIYAASPLACRLCDLYDKLIVSEEEREKWSKVRNWDKINFITDFSELEEKVLEGKPSIYIASAGMMNAGYSVFLAKQFIVGSNNTILFCGFMAPNTLGYKIKQKETKTITIEGEKYPARCNVIALNSFSSHMMHDELLEYYSNGNFLKIALVHGEMQDKLVFEQELKYVLAKKDKTNRVICVNKGSSIRL